MDCYQITFHDQYGTHTTTKWGNSPGEALDRARQAHKKRKKPIRYDEPVLLDPQPFSEESRRLRAREDTSAPPPAVEIHEAEEEEIDDSGIDRGED